MAKAADKSQYQYAEKRRIRKNFGRYAQTIPIPNYWKSIKVI